MRNLLALKFQTIAIHRMPFRSTGVFIQNVIVSFSLKWFSISDRAKSVEVFIRILDDKCFKSKDEYNSKLQLAISKGNLEENSYEMCANYSDFLKKN